MAFARKALDFAQNIALRSAIFALLLVPYRLRVRAMGAVVEKIVSPLAGYGKRVEDNLALILPDLPKSEVARLKSRVVNMAGRTLMEVYSGAQFKAHVAQSPIRGAGIEAILQARAAGQGVILVSGHFGNYDVPRAVLSAQGHSVGALYLPFRNPYFDAHYRATITAIGAPIFPRGRKGVSDMVRHLRAGGLMGLLNDQRIAHGADLTFFGHRAKTALSAAEMALKYNCLLIPVYGIRQEDGLSFELLIEAPIPHSTPERMTQALNDSLEAQVRAHLDQWFWVHRRWM
jgi:Kdo2-lipid IVA lauroyltransferase/acyltransferase